MNLINDNLQHLFDLCRRHKVSKLYAFGSILTSRFNENSDVDILVNFNSEINHNNYADNYFDFYNALKKLFGRNVDLVDETAVRNPFFKEELDETKCLIYG
ncbi:MAG: nucleotidyltransferase domain-containing protein [Muribaculaceae bacterium]|nr:nucleotidyltransferase [Bacteroidales bacterium]MBD5325492.1 nucleotidyltransferase [Bacteroides sp.]MDE6228453.1 nucleotidyltransferase domain-containing protein [Muribaculaceae bacterium]MBD5188414.1 nucleotidyltransferase [Bacteroidales bacterium]MBD5327133.1 nucleotidyltransferase [Bacteroides sp.]